MANTDVTLYSQEGTIFPSVSTVPVTEGDTISFSPPDGSPVILFFSPDAQSVLSPPPGAAFPLAQKFSFTFTGSAPGAYSAYFGSSAENAPGEFPGLKTQELIMEIAALMEPPPPFTGPNDTLHSGS